MIYTLFGVNIFDWIFNLFLVVAVGKVLFRFTVYPLRAKLRSGNLV